MDVKEIEDCCPDCGFLLEYYDEDDDTLDGCDTCKRIMADTRKTEIINSLFEKVDTFKELSDTVPLGIIGAISEKQRTINQLNKLFSEQELRDMLDSTLNKTKGRS